jgi:phospholipase/carboxylesterase
MNAGISANEVGIGGSGPLTESPTILYLHGRGADETSASLVRPAFSGARLVALRGRLREGAGYAWFRNESPGIADQGSLREEVSALEQALEREFREEEIWLCGFSNGAAMAASLLLSKPGRYRGALLLSGPIVDQQPWPAQRLKDLRVLFVYGSEDRAIPKQLMLASVAYINGLSGARASVIEVPTGHEISDITLHTVSRWFSEQQSLRRPR